MVLTYIIFDVIKTHFVVGGKKKFIVKLYKNSASQSDILKTCNNGINTFR